MAAMVGHKSEPLYVTLDADGNGSVQFTARKAGILTIVQKVTVEMSVTSSGVVAMYQNGGFLTSMPVGPKMTAVGEQALYCSEYITVSIVGGPINTEVKVTILYTEGSEP